MDQPMQLKWKFANTDPFIEMACNITKQNSSVGPDCWFFVNLQDLEKFKR